MRRHRQCRRPGNELTRRAHAGALKQSERSPCGPRALVTSAVITRAAVMPRASGFARGVDQQPAQDRGAGGAGRGGDGAHPMPGPGAAALPGLPHHQAGAARRCQLASSLRGAEPDLCCTSAWYSAVSAEVRVMRCVCGASQTGLRLVALRLFGRPARRTFGIETETRAARSM